MIWNYYYHSFGYLFSLSTLIVLIFIKKYTIIKKIFKLTLYLILKDGVMILLFTIIATAFFQLGVCFFCYYAKQSSPE